MLLVLSTMLSSRRFLLAVVAATIVCFQALTVLRASMYLSEQQQQQHIYGYGALSPFSERRGRGGGVLPRCRILIVSSYPWHYEVLESVMRVPFETYSLRGNDGAGATQDCDEKNVIFDLSLVEDTDSGFDEYFRTVMVLKYHVNDDTNPVHIGRMVPYDHNTTDPQYSAIVEATCHCTRSEGHVKFDAREWVAGYDRRRCVLHRHCPDTYNDPRFLSATPFNPRFFLSNVLPGSEESGLDRLGKRRSAVLETAVVARPPPFQLCVTGRTLARNYDLLREFLDNAGPRYTDDLITAKIRIHGEGCLPSSLRQHELRFHQSFISKYENYQTLVRTECDILLALVDKKEHENYFFDQLTGTMSQSSAHNIPIVIHEELAMTVYKDYLPDIYETHTDASGSFVDALKRILDKMDELSKSALMAKTPRSIETRNRGNLKMATELSDIWRPMCYDRASKHNCNVVFRDSTMQFCHTKTGVYYEGLWRFVLPQILEGRFECNARNTFRKYSISKEIALSRNAHEAQRPCLFLTGGVLHLTKSGDHIWGIGAVDNSMRVHQDQHEQSKNLSVYSVRGPFTASALKAMGIRGINHTKLEQSYGDLKFLLPRLFPEYLCKKNPAMVRKRTPRTCFFATDEEAQLDAVNNAPKDVTIVRLSQKWKSLYETFRVCDFVSSSTLTVLIAADSLGIPRQWFRFRRSSSEGKIESQYEVRDYMSGINYLVSGGASSTAPVEPEVGDFASNVLDHSKYTQPLSDAMRDMITRRLLDSFPFHLFTTEEAKVK